MNSTELGYRDAIHVPYIVVTCDQAVSPGDKVSLRDGKRCVWWGGYPDEPMWHGVVDPFIADALVEPGTPFRCMIRPECFTRLRHDFQIETRDRGGTDTCHAVCDIF